MLRHWIIYSRVQLFKKGEYKNARNQEIKKEIRIPFLALAAAVQEMDLSATFGGEVMDWIYYWDVSWGE